jgi:hypothetical protein
MDLTIKLRGQVINIVVPNNCGSMTVVINPSNSSESQVSNDSAASSARLSLDDFVPVGTWLQN